MFLDALVNGISLGAIFALIALGFVIVFKATNVVNFAHASIVGLGAYLIATWQDNITFWPAVAASAAACAVIAALMDFIVIRPMRKRRGGLEALAIITLGINIVLATEVQRRVGTDILSTGAPGGSNTVDLLGVNIAQTRVTALVVAVILMAGLFAAFRYTDLGVAMRSTAADPPTAALMGIRLGNVAMISWGIAGALAAVAGAFFASFPAAGVSDRTSFLALVAVPAAVAGGLDSLLGAVVGGLLIGCAVSFVTIYANDLSFLGGGLSEVAAYFVLLLILLWRPSGLFGEREVSRV